MTTLEKRLCHLPSHYQIYHHFLGSFRLRVFLGLPRKLLKGFFWVLQGNPWGFRDFTCGFTVYENDSLAFFRKIPKRYLGFLNGFLCVQSFFRRQLTERLFSLSVTKKIKKFLSFNH